MMRLCVLFVLLHSCLLCDGEKVLARINSIIEKKKAEALKEALDAEFELADVDENGVLNRAEFGKYLVREDGFKVREGKWLGEGKPADKVEQTQASLALGETEQVVDDSGFLSGFVNSVMMIVVTELGDKTFFIAALLAMKNSRIVVYVGAVGALFLMTALSVLIGSALPAFIPRKYTHYGAAVLFLVFGAKMLQEARELYVSPPAKNEELEEAEEEISSFFKGGGDVESASPTRKPKRKHLQILMQGFTMTFLAEWGDRSQIATIALAAHKDPFGVTAGGCLGHALCTGLAVVGGRLLATRISEKQITLTGGVLFCIFGLHSLVVGV
eukprot:CAMPEP_0203778870 /NCGR_PEP_ID=MMETSP0099_2-20121227/8295_1 /ASSEMBLY_ACC=CAM_ASM_000209 /TAXON_ID=96639 /ORGANISM=" , Strain NY0313808BC1" /LENGTH=327 /DNA_ID=CAMNT_0050678543 /DNA_START=1395 /DNA_END=2378 /DNA_ORIENTATION=+